MKKIAAKLSRSPKARKAAGVVLIVVGVAALVTPLTPGSWLALIGLELLGVRILFAERLAARLRRVVRAKQPPIDN
jgi:drug/metabolite transporter (DMT)-like permease